ncbi:PHP-associated domain-containing protein [Oceanobacillus timonensis]|uniref:PHP-associated domain-containing protein n=1 Tax=Oceanobacillus timonensis TaxID=1926285 RepID=UPI0009BAF6DC|nr:PHP-associated domain-containing protein [Oceanobacillus timonensis]
MNTSAKQKNPDGWYSSDEILELAYHYGVFVSFGSDAHTPERIGDDWEEVRQHLKKIGFDKVVFFRERQRVEVEI